MTLEFSGQTARGRALEEASDELWLDDVSSNMAAMVIRKRLMDKGSAHVRVATFATDNRPGVSEIRAPGYTLLDAGVGRPGPDGDQWPRQLRCALVALASAGK